MRILGYILLIGGLFYAFILYAKSKIKFDISLDKLDLAGILAAAISGDVPTLKTFLNINVKNDNPFTISFSNLDVKLFYQGSQVAQSVDVSAEKIVILPKLDQDFTHVLQITLSQAFLEALKTLKSGQPLVLQYVVKLRLFGIPIPAYKDNFTYIK